MALENHPNIVRCFYMDILDNQPFIVLEWIASKESKGADLRQSAVSELVGSAAAVAHFTVDGSVSSLRLQESVSLKPSVLDDEKRAFLQE